MMRVSSVVRLVTGPVIARPWTVVVVVPAPAVSSRLLLWAHGTTTDTDGRFLWTEFNWHRHAVRNLDRCSCHLLLWYVATSVSCDHTSCKKMNCGSGCFCPQPVFCVEHEPELLVVGSPAYPYIKKTQYLLNIIPWLCYDYIWILDIYLHVRVYLWIGQYLIVNI
jgi:hypothetical protein